MRARAKKPWIKLYVEQCLRGSIRWQFDSEERGVWYDLLLLAATMPYEGKFCDADGRPIPLEYIAYQLRIPLELLQRVIDKCLEEGRIYKNEHGYGITHWDEYQSAYKKTKQSRRKTWREQAYEETLVPEARMVDLTEEEEEDEGA